MILKLKSTQVFPPGGFCFKDERTGYEVKSSACFEQAPEGLAAKIIRVRRANPHKYPGSEAHWFDVNSVVQEIYAFKQRTNPELFTNYEGGLHVPMVNNNSNTVSVSGVTCKFCNSADVEGIKCLTCGGTKIKSYKCKTCGKGWPK